MSENERTKLSAYASGQTMPQKAIQKAEEIEEGRTGAKSKSQERTPA
ncbi:MAG: hypothetical protein CM15mV112_340 [uncultured marine virus]|nr:MAG: hypothetical protein CM15mV112_340 [uncultured marine virus]